MKNLEALDRELAETFKKEDAAAWLERLRAAGIPCGAVNRISEVIDHPQMKHRRILREVDAAEGGGEGDPLKLFGFPVKFSRSDVRLTPPPRLGEHTETVLAELGYSAEEIEGLRREGAI